MRCRSAFLINTNGFTLAALAILILLNGCGAKSWLDQSELSRNRLRKPSSMSTPLIPPPERTIATSRRMYSLWTLKWLTPCPDV